MWVIRAGEEQAPAGVAPLAWIVLTNVPVTTLAAARARREWSSCRVVVEEYHKAQKTGGASERMPFEYAARREPAIAVISVGAWVLLPVRAAGRDPALAEQPARGWVPGRWVEVVAAWRDGAATRALPVTEFVQALARWGGHPNRPSAGPPGGQTWWQGGAQRQALVQGVRLLQSHISGGA